MVSALLAMSDFRREALLVELMEQETVERLRHRSELSGVGVIEGRSWLGVLPMYDAG